MLKKILLHAIIVLSLMMLTFFVIDLVNESMAFLNNRITKTLCALLSLISLSLAAESLYGKKK